VVLGVVVTLGTLAYHRLPVLGANGLLHPSKRRVEAALVEQFPARRFTGAGVELEGWQVPAQGIRRGAAVYLHGIADNRGSSANAMRRLSQSGFDVIAYDSRAHGGSGGEACTFGYYEKRDLRRVIDTLPAGPVIVLGTSLGAAVALQAAAEDSRISAVVAAESFSDLRTVAGERAPWFFTAGAIERSFVVAALLGQFTVDDVSPMAAAKRIRVPVMLIHGADDTETPPEHSRKIYAALSGPRRLLLVPGAGHNHSLQPWVWDEIATWIDAASPGGVAGRRSEPE
jgi:pimeloyl-ACP methyl ester carboxylesterase